MVTHIITRSENSSTVTSSTLGKGSALSHQELDSNFINLRDGKLDNVDDDFTGELQIKGSGGSATGSVRLFDNDDSNYLAIKAPATIGSNYTLTMPANDGDSGEVLTTDGSGNLTWTDKTVDTTNLVSDTSPQLGGDLDINGQDIVTTSNGHIDIKPNGTGQVRIDTNIIEQYSGAGLVINHRGQGTHNGAAYGAPEGGETTGSTMLFNTGIQIEGRGAHEFPAVVLRNTSDATRYNNLWAAKARPTSGDYTVDDYLDEDDIIFRFFGAGYQGTDGQGNSVFSYGSATVDLYATENHSSTVNGGGFRVATLNTGVDAANGAETTKLDITDSVKVLNPKAATTAALNVEGSIRLKNGSTPSNVTDSSHFYAKDDGGVSHIYAVDEGGNEQKLSSHNSDNEWEYYSRNLNTGKVVRINMERMIRDIEKLTGKTYIENK
jgi:hypothetical protein